MDFEELANEHKDAVYRQMIRVCGNREDAEDVLIEALLKAYRNLEKLRDAEAFRGWLAIIARRICWQVKEQHALAPLLQLSALEDEGRQIASPEEPADAKLAMRQMKSVMAAALAALPPVDREVYELRDIQELPGEEVAQRLKISLSAMKSRLHRARRGLREQIDAALTGK
ncbi:sigma-24, ECF subfamily [Candidatus Koribacter versatilis Ellin345]|uniref:Sigma-24, ECF subfamily n=1 Tax=Koribacter versatilis (strain Ellin345) TaxID=204669 RepID=Q1IM17_KORVE|nr:sigma-70 family RNA polymerase sigma factor [Candidatus Koribacter versatilis]ABF42083.1 sigma-24, ECF subfamily [Candidatus Koribacter versatilis Ellin345]